MEKKEINRSEVVTLFKSLAVLAGLDKLEYKLINNDLVIVSPRFILKNIEICSISINYYLNRISLPIYVSNYNKMFIYGNKLRAVRSMCEFLLYGISLKEK